MSDWRIEVPFRDRGDPLADVPSLCRHAGLDGEQRVVVQRLVLGACVDGMRTVGELLDHLEALGPERRRVLLDRAREEAGLKTTSQVDAQRRFEVLQQGLVGKTERDSAGRALLTCAEPSCAAFPVNPATGAPARTNVRHWWCSRHEHLAQPGDMEPWRLRVRYRPSGAVEYVDDAEVEAKRREAADESRRRRRAQEEAERRAEGERMREHERVKREEMPTPANLRAR